MLRSMLPLGLSLVVVATVTGQTVESVIPDLWAPGVEVTITGSGFGTDKAPKVAGVRMDEKKGIKLKVLDFSDTSITAEVKKVPNSKNDPSDGKVWDVVVSTKSGGEASLAAAVTTQAPEVMLVNPTEAEPGEPVQVVVENLGSKKAKPKLKLGGKKMKVTDVVLQPLETEGATGTTTILEALMPKSLPNGVFDLLLEAKGGSAEAEMALEMIGSTKKLGKAKLDATINGDAFKVSGKTLVVQVNKGLNTIINGSKGNNPNQAIVIQVPYDPALDSPPATFTGLPDDSALFTYAETTLDGLVPTVTTWMGAGTWEVTVYSESGGQLGISFDGLLSSAGQEDKQVEGTVIGDL